MDKTLKLWDVATGNELRNLAGHCEPVFSVAFSPDGRSALSGSLDKTVKLWDVATGRELRISSGHTGWYKIRKLWDVATGKEPRTFAGHTDRVWSVAFPPGGGSVLSGSDDGALKLWT